MFDHVLHVRGNQAVSVPRYGERTRNGNGQGRVTEPKGDQFSGRNLGMIPKQTFYQILENLTESKGILLKAKTFQSQIFQDTYLKISQFKIKGEDYF